MNDQTTSGFVRFPRGAFGALRAALTEEQGPAEAAMTLRRIGSETGDAFLTAFRDWNRSRAGDAEPDALDPDRFWTELSAFFEELGWGSLEVERPHPGVIALLARDWAEADGNGEPGQPTCHFTTGMLAALLCGVAGADLAVMEVERCRFLVGGEQALLHVYERMRAGEPVDAAVAALV